ncbi:uncharacterized protein LOC134687015 isoform X2 [Mytilus trossulus]|uniref:uncharacterized protein LOC134687015 isoform X2 n=1 Tax=Mytilus trossulus TaxID=6551 RepID=UPI003007BDED
MRVLIWIILLEYCALINGLTRYTCLTSIGRGFIDGSSEEIGLGGGIPMSGSLSCDKPNSKILVTRIIHGFGNFRACANSDQSCDKEMYSDTTIASQCDGQDSCFIHTFPEWLEKCSMMSDFVHVEYECIFDTSLFDVCRETTKTVTDTSVYVVSPNVFKGPSSRNWKVCECIINSRFTEQVMADYIHSDVLANGDKCTANHVLIESKRLPNQTTIDKTVEVCGRRTVSNQMFRGSVRLTYKNSGGSSDDGFLAKFRVPPLDEGAEIKMQCGPVRSADDESDDTQPESSQSSQGFKSFRGNFNDRSGGRQSVWNNHPAMPPFIGSPITPWGALVPPFRNPHFHGWQQQSPQNRNNPWGTGNTNNSNNKWNSQKKGGSPWDNTNRGTSTNRPWPSQSSTNTRNINDLPLQSPRDPRRFSLTNEAHSSPSAGQLGVTNPPKQQTVTKVTSSQSDPRIMAVDRSPGFIPWTQTNPKPKIKNGFIPWTSVKNQKKNVKTSGSNIQTDTIHVSQSKTPRVQASTEGPRLPSSVQFIGNKQSLRMTGEAAKINNDTDPSPPTRLTAETDSKRNSSKGESLAYIIGGTGAGLIAFCCFACFVIRKSRSRDETQQKSCDIEQNCNDSISDDPTYATPSEVSLRTPCPALDNDAYEEDQPPTNTVEVNEENGDIEQTCSDSINGDPTYATPSEVSLRTTCHALNDAYQLDQPPTNTVEVNEENGDSAIITSISTQTYTDYTEENSIYDNNFKN